ncbi:hypothetical protein RYH80_15290 [Halobaculum sp. MBLA0147]|uniref:hypothetical protein n=1 Tax=Halobaculum sp. MBLA0147 TaxID=3079934 RepID=UPI003523CFA3
MPTNEQISAAIQDTYDKLDQLGVTVENVHWPNEDLEEIGSDEPSRGSIVFETAQSSLWVSFTERDPYAQVVYTFSFPNIIGKNLTKDETRSLADLQNPEESVSEMDEERLNITAGKQVLDQTPEQELSGIWSYLYLYGSSETVSLQLSTSEEGILTHYQCLRSMFPYSDGYSLEKMNDVIMSVNNMGFRTRQMLSDNLQFVRDPDNSEVEEYYITFETN